MRKSLFVGLLATLIAVAVVFPFFRSDAAPAPDRNSQASGRLPPATLPNFDIRLAGKGEFTDVDLSSTVATETSALAPTVQARASALDQFRSSLKTEDANNLRAQVNEAGALKNFFVDGGTLSAPQSDTADNIARGFLKQYPSLFALSDADVSSLALVNEDNDNGTVFLKYAQTVGGGIKVFEGAVQVVVNKNGEVLSVREGFLVS